MDVEDYYGRLRNRYASVPDRQELALSMDQLTDLLDCTRRNVQFVLGKMVEKGYIEWRAGRGRGNRSRIVFLKSRRELAWAKAKELVERERISEAWRALESAKDAVLQHEFTEWLTQRFGLRQDPDERDVLRFPFYRPVPALDPAFVHRRTEAHWIRQIFNTLVVYSPKDCRVRQKLAHHWEPDDSMTRWTFYLRKGIRFHHGKPLTAMDVEFTFRRILAVSPSAWMVSVIREIRVIGKYSIEFRLWQPNALFAHMICTERYSIVPEDLNEFPLAESFRGMPIGTGPFKAVKNDDSMLLLEANEHYFEGCPHLDRIEMWVWPNYEGKPGVRIPERDAQLLYSEIQARQSAVPSLTQPENGSTYLTFNMHKEGVQRKAVFRQAIHRMLDRQRMVSELGGIRQCPSVGFRVSGKQGAYRSPYDEELAGDLLKQSGYAGETLRLYTYEMRSNEENAEWIREACGRFGVRLEVAVLPIEKLADREIIAQADMIVAGEVLGEQPDITLIEMYKAGNGFIRNHMSRESQEEAGRRISSFLRKGDSGTGSDELSEIEEFLKRKYEVLFLYHSVQTVGHHPLLGGIALNAWGKIDYKDVWVKRRHDHGHPQVL